MKVSCHLAIMSKVFGLRRLSDALEMITPKKLRKRYERLDEEDDLLDLDEKSSQLTSSGMREEESVEEEEGARLKPVFVREREEMKAKQAERELGLDGLAKDGETQREVLNNFQIQRLKT